MGELPPAHTRKGYKMKVTIKAESKFAKPEIMENVDFDLVSIKETNRRNGWKGFEIRVANGKRHIIFGNGVYNTITVQDEETGRFLVKYNRD